MSADSPEVLLEGKVFRVERRRGSTPDGAPLVREVVVHPGAVVILPLLADGRVCLIQNQRIAVDETLIELPAGTREAGEDPLETARRELAEETGYRCGTIELLTEFYMSPGILNERMSLYLARDLTPGSTNLDAGESIEPLLVAWDEALAMAVDGRIRDAKTLVGLLYYERLIEKDRPV
jgi:ADP-ribose pyrophosphatase